MVWQYCFSAAAQQSSVFIHSGKAIRGYDPVSYFIDRKPLPGKEELTYKWNNADWYFSDQQHLDSFKANPEKYMPQYGGYCAYGMYEGHKAPTDPFSLAFRLLWHAAASKKERLINGITDEQIKRTTKNENIGLVCNVIIMGIAFINPWAALALSFAMWIYWIVFA